MDDTKRTAPDLANWKVLYDGYSDIAFDPNSLYVFRNDTLTIADQIELKFQVENISDIDFDSLLVAYIFTGSDNKTISLEKRYPPIPAGSKLVIDQNFDTDTLTSGNYLLSVQLNPYRKQPESYYGNK